MLIINQFGNESLIFCVSDGHGIRSIDTAILRNSPDSDTEAAVWTNSLEGSLLLLAPFHLHFPHSDHEGSYSGNQLYYIGQKRRHSSGYNLYGDMDVLMVTVT